MKNCISKKFQNVKMMSNKKIKKWKKDFHATLLHMVFSITSAMLF